MTGEETVQALNVTAATLLIQLLLSGMLSVASALIPKPEYQVRESPLPRQSVILFFTLITFAVLLASADMYSVWRPLFPGVELNIMSSSTATLIVFSVDIALMVFLMGSASNGGENPFSAGLLMVPALAIFLRESPARFISYAVVAGLAYCIITRAASVRQRTVETAMQGKSTNSAIFMTIACLALTMFTGYITRPVPIQTSASSAPTAIEEGEKLKMPDPSKK
jgi:hypothetical protein